MNNQICKFSEGMVTIPEGYTERTLNTLADKRSVLPPITLSRDALGNHNCTEEYIESQLGTLSKQVKDWQQAPGESITLGDNVATGLLISYNFLRPDNHRQYQKQAIFTFNTDDLLIFTLSKASPITDKEMQCFTDTLNSFRTHD